VRKQRLTPSVPLTTDVGAGLAGSQICVFTRRYLARICHSTVRMMLSQVIACARARGNFRLWVLAFTAKAVGLFASRRSAKRNAMVGGPGPSGTR
jgi:hypothetical protein